MSEKTNNLLSDGHQLSPKHVGTIINKYKHCTSWC